MKNIIKVIVTILGTLAIYMTIFAIASKSGYVECNPITASISAMCATVPTLWRSLPITAVACLCAGVFLLVLCFDTNKTERKWLLPITGIGTLVSIGYGFYQIPEKLIYWTSEVGNVFGSPVTFHSHQSLIGTLLMLTPLIASIILAVTGAKALFKQWEEKKMAKKEQ